MKHQAKSTLKEVEDKMKYCTISLFNENNSNQCIVYVLEYDVDNPP